MHSYWCVQARNLLVERKRAREAAIRLDLGNLANVEGVELLIQSGEQVIKLSQLIACEI